ncbi:hypothetical protein M153_8270002838 [Pseudoloma neurophilia]|uniref:Uncharacterized protein n=1 Tax=Pseudoloma neurophilia TaxID=146866 RepID=A0A0R0LWD3_9MICR|nr:hypothetical protein M153_8270002838 [Pseudoloma neurophilia]
MGFKNSPMIMQRTMNQIFDGIIGKNVMIYIEYIIIFDADINKQKKILKKLLEDLIKIILESIKQKYNFVRMK